MNKGNIKKVLAHLKTVPDGAFDMDIPKKCIIGHAVTLIREDEKHLPVWAWLGLPDRAAFTIFYPVDCDGLDFESPRTDATAFLEDVVEGRMVFDGDQAWRRVDG